MFKNKLLNISLIIIIAITLLGIVAYFLYQYIFYDVSQQEEVPIEPTIDEIIPLTVNVPKISTNLGDSTIIVLELTLQMDNEDAKIEAEKRMFQIKDRINLYLKNLTYESFSTEEKIKKFKTNLIGRLNNILQDGKVVNIDITQLFLQ
ncbi:hypothetical protein BHF71_00430 [Vulcanibacillus modesticaldus]|uniref:Flagellar protein FliL n=1 Tax=Vulcanibacillus modesticaldus TaxID=337097 RepID=A0A1D2YXL7_9BACI|nr:flagellar basal body-associated FliL family protein [Vulcanibacillus modesticaldus]OEG00410.1 hypothetical protein BHF71_00430 [Vulcanibacillus modesticaldus]